MLARSIGVLLGLTASGLAAAANAEAPHQFYDAGPAQGASEIEYNGRLRFGTADSHNVEVLHGFSQRLALGFELEGESARGGFEVEEAAVTAIVRLTPDGSDLSVALLGQAGVELGHGDGRPLETRLIVGREDEAWRALANLIVRRTGPRSALADGSSLGYAVTIDHKLSRTAWVGIESSGDAARLGGYRASFETAHYAGPRISAVWDVTAGREIEFSASYLIRLAGGPPDSALRLSLGVEF